MAATHAARPLTLARACAQPAHLFQVGMTCNGCKGAVTRILTGMPGVESFDANVEKKEVTVVGEREQAPPTLRRARPHARPAIPQALWTPTRCWRS
jgi:copper chaperone CopZ